MFISSTRILAASACGLLCLAASAEAAGILTDGFDATSQAMGGVGVMGFQTNVTTALGANPAALSLVTRPRVEATGEFGWVNGDFHNRSNSDAKLHDFGAAPAGAIGGRWGNFALGLGVVEDAAIQADWRYRDTPGGLTGITSYGTRDHESEITLTRIALGASYSFVPQFSLGASIGILYNHNRLTSPYIIQTQPNLAGAKTLLDMQTDGWGVNAQFGALWQPIETVRVGFSYTLPSRLYTTGHATADSTQQLADLGLTGVDAKAGFDAEVINEFPAQFSLGASWQATKNLQLFLQGDFIQWSDSFDTLEVRLRNVKNPLYKTLLGNRNHLDDDVPLDWKDQWVIRAGAEYKLGEHYALRAGYRYSKNPTNTETLTPLTAAIDEHVLTAGLGAKFGRFNADLSYQYHLPQHEHISNTRLLGGEYGNSDIDVSLHVVTLTIGFEF